MAPPAAAPSKRYLEHPDQAFKYFQTRSVDDAVAEEKHMGSRALLVVARDAARAKSRFGVSDGKAGAAYTRTGRAFFENESTEAEVIARLRAALDAMGLWGELASDWILLDAEVMPWSAKARGLLRSLYRPTATGSRAAAEALLEAISRHSGSADLESLRSAAGRQAANATRMGAVLEGYCWPVDQVDDYRIAPFHLLAAEGRVLADMPHAWHMETVAKLAASDPILQETAWRRFNPSRASDRAEIVEWWTQHTDQGGEGLVMKPNAWPSRGSGKFVQPAIKVRGREYLRIIYGPDYCEPRNIERLRHRALGAKRSRAAREYELGLEGLHRFVERQPLATVHECALGVLAFESEPVDPRL